MSNKRQKYANPPDSVTMVFRPRGKSLKKGSQNRRVIAIGLDEKREYFLHSTKGYRNRRK